MYYNVLVIDDDPFQCKTTQLAIEKLFHYNVTGITSGKEAIEFLLSEKGNKINLVILDLSMPEVDGLEVLDKVCAARPDLPIIINTAYGDVKKAVEAIRLGAVDFIEKQDGPERLKVSIDNVRLMAGLRKEIKKLNSFNNNRYSFEDIIGTSPAIQKTVNQAKKSAKSNIAVMITGDSGVGKELFARSIHCNSSRANKPFVAVNCGAIPHNLAESILFGHEKGSFTGATEKSLGKFREAHGGTIFLDEVGELPLETQVKLLRVLQNFEVEPVGAAKEIDVDVRIISATNKDLERAVAEGRFREDLYYRLNVFNVDVPSLKQRKDDIPSLLQHFVEKICLREKKKIMQLENELVSMLREYHWPGNVRQLENAIYRAIVLSNGDKLSMYDFENILSAISKGTGEDSIMQKQIRPDNIAFANAKEAKFKTIAQHERDIIVNALEFYNYNISKVSKVLDIGRSTLYRKMKEYNIEMQGTIEEIEDFKKSSGSTIYNH